MNNKQYFTKGITLVVLVAAAILSIPLVAKRFTDEVDWKLFDFLVMGVLLVGTGFMGLVGCRLVSSTASRIVIGAVLGLALLLTWAELAVGWLGTPFAGS